MSMKQLFLEALLLCSLVPASAFADSLTIGLSPNDGSGDNFGFQLQGAGYTVFGGGGIPYDNFNDQGYAPGSFIDISGPIYFDFGEVTIGSQSYEIDFGVGDLFSSFFNLPTSIQDVVKLPIEIDFGVDGMLLGHHIGVGGGAGGYITFDYFNGLYYAEGMTLTGTGQVNPPISATPEPGTLFLIGTGIPLLVLVTRYHKTASRSISALA